MITGIELSCGPYDGKIANIKTPIPFVLVIEGYAYYRVGDADKPNEEGNKSISGSPVYECVRDQRKLKASDVLDLSEEI